MSADPMDSLLMSLVEREIPEGRNALLESHRNLAELAEYCKENYINSEDKTLALEETKRFASQSLSSVAYQVHSLAVNILQMMDQQTIQVQKMQSNAVNIGLQVDIHKEKVARREIGVLTSSKNFSRAHKVVPPTEPEKVKKYKREEIDYSALDNIGHAVKSGLREEMPPERHSSQSSSSGSLKETSNSSARSSSLGSIGGLPASVFSSNSSEKKGAFGNTMPPPHRPPVAPVAPFKFKAAPVPPTIPLASVSSQVEPAVPSSPGPEPVSPLPPLTPGISVDSSVDELSYTEAEKPVRQESLRMKDRRDMYEDVTLDDVISALSSSSVPLAPPPPPSSVPSVPAVPPLPPSTVPVAPPLPPSTVPAAPPLPPSMVSTQTDKGNSDVYAVPHNNMLAETSDDFPESVGDIDELPPPPPDNLYDAHDHNIYDKIPSPMPPPPPMETSEVSHVVPDNYVEKVVAIYDYQKLRDDELEIVEGDIIYVIKKNEDGWFEGISEGVQGLFPGNYVTPYM